MMVFFNSWTGFRMRMDHHWPGWIKPVRLWGRFQ